MKLWDVVKVVGSTRPAVWGYNDGEFISLMNAIRMIKTASNEND